MSLPKEAILTYVNDMLVNSFRSLKDESFQKRVWFEALGPEVSTYIDTVAHFLDRCEAIFDVPDHVEYLGKENYVELKRLYDLVLSHVTSTERKIDPYLMKADMLLNDPQWHDIQTLAGEVESKLIEFIKRKEYEQGKNTK